MIFIEMEE